MKLHALSAAVLAPMFLFGPMIQDSGQVEMKAKLEEQGRELAELKVKLTETRDLVDMTLIYMKDQASAAEALQKSLVDVEAQGFIAGINPRSRETLLGSWRGYLGDQQAGLPAVPAKEKKQP